MDHPIPEAALDEDIAILGKKGGGKTFTAKGIVERLLDLGRRVLILDPLGVWAGLRTSADGEKPGYPVAIFGGLHGDLPLDPAAAEALAQIIGAENLPAVIDLSDLSKHAQQAFLLKFLMELRRVNTEALTIVLEEADVFAPQQPMGDDSKALHGEIDWIARRGRFKGFRLLTITQRPARLSKDVLTQCSTLIAHRLPAPQDRDAVKAWVDGNGDKDVAREVFDTLATLSVGEAWLYAPEHGVLERVKFPKIKTLDTSATPRAGEKRIAPKTLAQVDVSGVSAALAEAMSISEPSKEGKKMNMPSTAELDRLQQEAWADGHATGHRDGFEAGRMAAGRRVLELVQTFVLEIAEPAPKLPFKVQTITVTGGDEPSESPTRWVPEIDPYLAGIAARNEDLPSLPNDAPTVNKVGVSPIGEIKRGIPYDEDPLLMTAISVWPARLTWSQIAAMCGRKARGGHFNTKRKALLELGLVREELGLVVVANPPTVSEGTVPADLLEKNLPQPAAKMFAAIRNRPGISVEQLAQHLGMQPRGGHWNTGMSTLKRNGLVQDVGAGLEIVPSLEAAHG